MRESFTVTVDGVKYRVDLVSENDNDEWTVVDCPVYEVGTGHWVANIDQGYAERHFSYPDRPPTEIEVKFALDEDGCRPMTEREKVEVEVLHAQQRVENAESWVRSAQFAVKRAEEHLPLAVERAKAALAEEKARLASYEQDREKVKAALEAAKAKLNAIPTAAV